MGSCPPSLFREIPAREQKKLRRVCAFAHEHLSALKRRSGESYAEHGCDVAMVLREVTLDPSLLAVAMVHDILVHPQGAALLRASPLERAERTLVKAMHELRRLHLVTNAEDLELVIRAFTADRRLMLLRMAHRLSDVRHLKRFDPELRQELAKESLHMYASIAARTGMQAWRHEMEEACFPIVQPDEAKALKREFTRRRRADELCLRRARLFLRRRLREHGVTAWIHTRIKGLYSTHRKMTIKRRAFDALTDRLALRVIVPTEEDCYRALGAVHDGFRPMPGKMKDYIGLPKENGYRSIHTVICPQPDVTDQPMEIQIRTPEMARQSAEGAASHHAYKQATYGLTPGELYRDLRRLRDEARTPGHGEFL